MTTVHPRERTQPRVLHTKARPLLVVLATTALVLVLLVLPYASGVEATSDLLSPRTPGEHGFIAGHRGDKADAPENTLPALQRAIDSAAEFVETDVQLTADGVPVLMHDWTVDRTTDGTGPVWAWTYDRLSTLDAGSWYSADFAGTRVPTLGEFLGIFAPSSKRAIIELKGSWTAEQSRLVTSQIQDAGVQSRVLLASFDLMTLQALESVAPSISRAIITREIIGDPAVLAEACGAIAVITSHGFVSANPSVVERIHAAGLAVLLYTLNDSDGWATATELGVDGIITDQPDKLGKWLSADADEGAFALEGVESASG